MMAVVVHSCFWCVVQDGNDRVLAKRPSGLFTRMSYDSCSYSHVRETDRYRGVFESGKPTARKEENTRIFNQVLILRTSRCSLGTYVVDHGKTHDNGPLRNKKRLSSAHSSCREQWVGYRSMKQLVWRGRPHTERALGCRRPTNGVSERSAPATKGTPLSQKAYVYDMRYGVFVCPSQNPTSEQHRDAKCAPNTKLLR